MQRSSAPAASRPDPHIRLRRLKLAMAALSGGLFATLWWLVGAHAVGSATAAANPTPVEQPAVIAPQSGDDEFFGGGSSLSSGGVQQPVMRSSGS